MEKVLFEETQYYRGGYLWLVFAIPGVFLAAVIVLALSAGKDELMAEVIPLTVAFVCSLVFALLFCFTRLTIRITEEGIFLRHSPFRGKFRFLPLAEIDKLYVRDFSPMGEYGGWGLRFVIGERAYIVSGKTGIQVVLKTGRKILFTTRKAQQAEAAIGQLQRQNEG